MENFVSNIYDSSKFGAEYKEILQSLSMFLIGDTEEENAIGFIDKDELKAKDPEIDNSNSSTDVSKNSINDSSSEAKSGENFVEEILQKVSIETDHNN